MGQTFDITKQLLQVQNNITNEILSALQYIVDWECVHPEDKRVASDYEQLDKGLAAYEYRIKQEFGRYICLYNHNKRLSDTMERSMLENMEKAILPGLGIHKKFPPMPWGK